MHVYYYIALKEQSTPNNGQELLPTKRQTKLEWCSNLQVCALLLDVLRYSSVYTQVMMSRSLSFAFPTMENGSSLSIQIIF